MSDRDGGRELVAGGDAASPRARGEEDEKGTAGAGRAAGDAKEDQDPLVAYNSEKVLSSEKFILRRKRGQISPPRGGFDKDAENQQLVQIPEEEGSDSSTSDPSEDLEQEFFDSLDPADLKLLLKRLKQEERKEKAERRKRRKAARNAARERDNPKSSKKKKKKKKRKKKDTNKERRREDDERVKRRKR